MRLRLVKEDLDTVLISHLENCRYLSGFTGSAGMLLISEDKATLATDFRYIEQAETQAPHFDIAHIRGTAKERFLLELASKLGTKRLGFEADSLSFSDYCRLKEEADKLDIQLVSTQGLVESIRSVKEEEEIALLERAAALADAALEYISGDILPGMQEKEVAWKIERFLREKGSESIPFDIIVASGPNAALPHARPTERSVSSGEPVIIDLGARVAGYTSDLTRTICPGQPDATFSRVYGLVLEAQRNAICNLEAGMTGGRIDRLAREVIERGGYKDSFGHGLGHGVGLETHESPRLGPGSTDTVKENMVFTIEPGIYLSGWGGVRIEDMVVVQESRARVLTKVKK